MQANDITISAFDASTIIGLANSLNEDTAMEEYGLFLTDTSDEQQQGFASKQILMFFANVKVLVRELNTILQQKIEEE